MRRLLCAVLLVAPAFAGQLPVRVSWENQPSVRIVAATPGVEVREQARTADSVKILLVYPDEPDLRLPNLHVIWSDLIAQSDADTARRLMQDSAFRPNEPKFTIFLNAESTSGFTVGVPAVPRPCLPTWKIWRPP